MDFIAHLLWTWIVFYRSKILKYALLVGVLPDFLSWGIYSVSRINEQVIGRPILSELPNWLFTSYNITHSLVIFLLVFGLVWLIFKKVPFYLFAWPVHIGMDMFSHTKEFFPTPFLWPLSNFTFSGVVWASPKFMLINYGLIVVFAVTMLIFKKNLLLMIKDKVKSYF
ncbi:hypothetical protein ACFLZ7_02200 [Nanoarchaeota archaeon]